MSLYRVARPRCVKIDNIARIGNTSICVLRNSIGDSLAIAQIMTWCHERNITLTNVDFDLRYYVAFDGQKKLILKGLSHNNAQWGLIISKSLLGYIY